MVVCGRARKFASVRFKHTTLIWLSVRIQSHWRLANISVNRFATRLAPVFWESSKAQSSARKLLRFRFPLQHIGRRFQCSSTFDR
jgi:hypothetical protein